MEAQNESNKRPQGSPEEENELQLKRNKMSTDAKNDDDIQSANCTGNSQTLPSTPTVNTFNVTSAMQLRRVLTPPLRDKELYYYKYILHLSRLTS